MLFTRLLPLALLIAAISLSSPAAARSDADLKGVVATLEGGYALLHDLQATFSQRTTIASMKREAQGSGELFIKKPAKGPSLFRFNYQKPNQEIVCDGSTVWYYQPDDRQVVV